MGDFGMCGGEVKIGPSVLESAVISFNLKSQKSPRVCSPGFLVYQASELCGTQRKETKWPS